VGVLFPPVEFRPGFFGPPASTLSQPTNHATARRNLQIVPAHLLDLLLGIQRRLLAFPSGLVTRDRFE
jgi:hypothetical protein